MRHTTTLPILLWGFLCSFTGIFLGGCVPSSLSVSGRGAQIPSFDGYPLMVYEFTSGDKTQREGPATALLFYIQGSDYATAINDNTLESFASATTLGSRVIVVEKRGVRPDTVMLDSCYFHADKETRVKDELAVINAYIQATAPNTPIVLMGTSEGGDIAAEVAARDKRVTHLILLGSGGGWSQEQEFRHFIRTRSPYMGMQTEAEFDSILAEIRSRPNSLELWAGHPFKRWSSYLFSPPINSLLKVDIPIFLQQGGMDESVPVESARAVADAFRMKGKTNLTYKEYARADHRLTDVQKGISLYPRLEVDIIEWLVGQGLLPESDAKMFTSRVRKAHKEAFAE